MYFEYIKCIKKCFIKLCGIVVLSCMKNNMNSVKFLYIFFNVFLCKDKRIILDKKFWLINNLFLMFIKRGSGFCV